MNPTAQLTAAERELNAALATFNIARLSLNTTLSGVGAREGASDRLISHTEEYGVDHTLSQLRKNPSTFDLSGPIPEGALAQLKNHLTRARDANEGVDLAMAKREKLATAADPSRPKALMVFGRQVFFDPDAGTAHDRDTGTVSPATFENVQTKEPDRKRDRDRN
ncbi:hypothetical protein [Hyphomicrobium sp. NDB2Meth4]|uniref:hypothetical protein n=1 Tax=Hyphomicrobium sp. NDB2Meth4 TaxID=1892846 RepID=UPI000931217F|nr:hypothetical protein [Hyphomicrobium sp. NDB2Meth4]